MFGPFILALYILVPDMKMAGEMVQDMLSEVLKPYELEPFRLKFNLHALRHLNSGRPHG